MSTPEDDEAGLEALQAQRANLADRLRPPWWYLAGFGIVMVLVCAVPFATRYLSWGNWSVLLALAVFYLLQAGLARASGVAIGTRTLRYRSGRVAGIALMVVVIGAVVAEILLLDHAQGGRALVLAIFAVAVAVVCWRAHLRGIRHDLCTGAGTESL